jgi:hypothetical protein
MPYLPQADRSEDLIDMILPNNAPKDSNYTADTNYTANYDKVDEIIATVNREGLWMVLFRQERFLLWVSAIIQLANVGCLILVNLLIHTVLLSLECNNKDAEKEVC